MRVFFTPALLLVLSGCAAVAVPPGLTIASYSGDGVSYLATNKSVTDHMLSDALGRNCAIWRILRGKSICKDFTPAEVAARAKARREMRYDEERAQVAQIDGPYSPSGTIAGTATARAPKKTATPPAGAGNTKVTRENLIAVAPAAGGVGTRPRAGTAKPSPARARQVGRSSISSRRARASSPGQRRYIVFGSFRSKRAAARLARRHHILDPFIVPARVHARTYYRVVTQPQGRAGIAVAFRSLKRTGVRDAYAIRACRFGRVNSRCLRQVPRQIRVTKKSIEDLITPRQSARPGPAARVAGG